jgi:fucose permease
MNRNLILLSIAYFAFIVIGMTASLLNIAWVYIEGTFRLSLESLGILLMAGMTGRLIASFLSGRVLSSLPMGTFLVSGCVLGAVGSLGYILSPIWITLLLTAFVLNIGEGILDAGLNTFVSAHYKTSHMNWLHAFFGVGLTFGPPLVTLIVVDLGQSWRLSYGVAMILQLLAGFLFLMTIKDWKLEKEQPETTKLPSVSMMSTLRMPIVWLSLALFFVYGGVEIGGGQLTNSLLTQGRGIDAKTASTWVSIYWGTFTLGRMVMGAVANRVSNNTLMRSNIFGALAGSVMVWLNLSNTLTFFGLALLGFALAPMFPTLISDTPRRVGLRHTANAIGFQVGITGLGGTLIPGLAGKLAGSAGLEVIGLIITVNAVGIVLIHEWILLRESRELPVLLGSSD